MGGTTFSEEAWDEYLDWQSRDRKSLKKINNLIKDIHRNGAITGIGKPEPLIGEGDKYSRRIDEKNRLVYKYGENRELYIISCKGHYDDK